MGHQLSVVAAAIGGTRFGSVGFHPPEPGAARRGTPAEEVAKPMAGHSAVLEHTFQHKPSRPAGGRQ